MLEEGCLLEHQVNLIEITSIDHISVWQGWTMAISLPLIIGFGFLVIYAVFKDLKIHLR